MHICHSYTSTLYMYAHIYIHKLTSTFCRHDIYT